MADPRVDIFEMMMEAANRHFEMMMEAADKKMMEAANRHFEMMMEAADKKMAADLDALQSNIQGRIDALQDELHGWAMERRRDRSHQLLFELKREIRRRKHERRRRKEGEAR